MKTADKKAESFIQRLAEDGICFSDDTRKRIKEAASIFAKEQDRDTRHACAEALQSSSSYNSSDHLTVRAQEAHNICMNVKAV